MLAEPKRCWTHTPRAKVTSSLTRCRATSERFCGTSRSDLMLLNDDITIDGLTRDWTIAQRKRGHRHSTDDLLTGWYATECAPNPERILDIGSGIGSVGLLALWRSPRATLTAV